ncbi:MAG: pyruvate formate-lyase-activating protein [Bacteroidota bacterium]
METTRTDPSIVPALQVKRKEGELNVHSVESFGTYDGPAIRFVAFFQGCPFQCLYCANPDTMHFGEGQPYTVDALFEQVMHMKPYFTNGGGFTASGGEPCFQAKGLIPLFKKLKQAGIHLALDTNGYLMNKYVRELLDLTDLVLLDVKHIDASIHRSLTGKGNEKTLDFASYLKTIGKPMWLRYVLVPGWTDQTECLHRLGQRFAEYANIEKLEIQPYHTLGTHKWELLNKEYVLKDVPANTEEQVAHARRIFMNYFNEVVVN